MTQLSEDLAAFIRRSPSPYHAVAAVGAVLAERGFAEFRYSPSDALTASAGFIRRGGTLIAWSVGRVPQPLRVIGAHTDSPNLRIKPHPDSRGFGVTQLAVEPYGGVLLNSWLNRDLGISGRVVVNTATGPSTRLIHVDEPVLTIPQLAIHLDREINERGLLLDRQRHLNPIWGFDTPTAPRLSQWLAPRLDVAPEDVISWDLMCHDLTPPTHIGRDREFLASARLDNLCSSFGALSALCDHDPSTTNSGLLIALFDHEEVGSETATGAGSPLLRRVGDAIFRAQGADQSMIDTLWAASRLLSADMAHATNPNFPERHEPLHPIILGGGPVVKFNANQRYATDAETAGEFISVAERVGVRTQSYSHRADLACGSTIGPIVASRLGIPTVDVGMPQLSMHSAREMMAAVDVDAMCVAFSAWATSPLRV
jgi:aspartyl aminopeptidase